MNHSVTTNDTSPEALAVQLDGLRRMSPQQRIAKMSSLTRRVKNMAFEAIRRRYPELDEEEIRLLFIELTYGKSLADEIRHWKQRADD